MKALQPVANVFENLKSLAATLGLGILGNAAFEFIRDPENSEKIGKFFGFIQKNAKFILNWYGYSCCATLISTLGGVIEQSKLHLVV